MVDLSDRGPPPVGGRKKACDSCHKRKIQCDGATPQCNWCKHHGLPCTFVRESGRKRRASAVGTIRSGSQNDLAKRMDRIEQLLEGARQAWTSRAADGPSPVPEEPEPTPPSSSSAGVETSPPVLSPSGISAGMNNVKIDSSMAMDVDFQADLVHPELQQNSFQSPIQQQQQRQQQPQSAGTAYTELSWDMVSPQAASVTCGGLKFGELRFAGFSLGEISSCNGIPFFSAAGLEWIRERTGEEPSFESLFARGPLWQRQPTGWRGSAMPTTPQNNFTSPDSADSPMLLPPNPVVELPDRETTEIWAAVLRNSLFGLAFPMLDPVLFTDTINSAYRHVDADQTSSGSVDINTTRAKACVFAFFSLASLFQRDAPGMPPIEDGDGYAMAAHNMLQQMSTCLSVTVLETTCILCMYYLFSGDLQSGILLLSNACRILFMLSGHKVEASTPEVAEGTTEDAELSRRLRRHLHKLFLMCYQLDKQFTLRTGLPPSIDDDYVDLPELMSKLRELYAPQLQELKAHAGAVSPMLLAEAEKWEVLDPFYRELTIVMSKTSRKLYSAAAMRMSDAELLRDIRELDDELERWRQWVPKSHRPSLNFTESSLTQFPPGMSPEDSFSPQPYRINISDAVENMHKSHLSMQEIVVHFEYHHLVATIHRASARCHIWANGEARDLVGVSTSQELSVQASRSTLFYLRAAVHNLSAMSFWIIVFYPTSAVLTIFCNLLLNPLAKNASTDLLLLNSIPEMIKEMRTFNLTPNELVHMKMVDEFIQELTRLANCAITKARRELGIQQ